MFSNANSLKSKIMNMAIDFDVLRKALGNTVKAALDTLSKTIQICTRYFF